jgi:hypothetical protein
MTTSEYRLPVRATGEQIFPNPVRGVAGRR